MLIIKALFFGAVQGLTEFLPISSSGHLYILKKILNLHMVMLPYFVWLHMATLVSLFIFFRDDFRKFLKEKKNYFYLAVVTFFSGGLAFILKEIGILNIFEQNKFLGIAFIVNGLILLFSKKLFLGTKTINDLTFKDMVYLGIAQALAIIPGISRSGITITALLFRGLKPTSAFKISFIMGAPIIILAFLWETYENINQLNYPIMFILTGFCGAFFFGLGALYLLKMFINRGKLWKFAYYCFIIGIGVLLWQ